MAAPTPQQIITNSTGSATIPTPTESVTATANTTTPSTAGSIRNINQTVQEREIVKTAPDLIIYLDGKTYLLNPYITNSLQNQPYTFVSFNDYLQNFSASYDVDNLIPTSNFTLQVPVQQKYLFQAPGGNNLIESMMEVQVFAKGYFPSGNGNTVYYRVFKGMTSHVAHTDNGTFLEISVQCLGIMHLLEFMYSDQNVALNTNSERSLTILSTNQAALSPYQALADLFMRAISLEGFQLNSIQQGKVANSYWAQGVEDGYVNKWQTLLLHLRKEVHITGWNMGDSFSQNINGYTAPYGDAVGTGDPRLLAAKNAVAPLLSRIQPNPDYFVDVIRSYLPEMTIGQIQLVDGRITSRLERVRTILQYIGYEGFQDLDGTIIFKPPLYNLDVRNIGDVQPTQSKTSASSSVDITSSTNPFIVHLSEIETESESEDQQGIKATRMTIRPDWLANNKLIAAEHSTLLPAITHIDIAKLAKFGLREEPMRTIHWLGQQDKMACYMYAVSELNRANRGWRQYNLTIPLRPELKLGYPMYLPHKDMFGYIKVISISYSQGGAATMSIMLDTLRKRPLFPSTAQQADASGNLQNVTLYTTQPNLVMQWTDLNITTGDSGLQNLDTSMFGGNPPPTSQSPATMSNGLPVDTSAVLDGGFATQPQNTNKPIYQEELEIVSNRRVQLGTSWSTKADTTGKCFRPQADSATSDDANNISGNGSNIQEGKPFFSANNWGPGTKGVNVTYMQKILSSQPFTDEGGYELVSPFPWGRWKSLKQAIYETHQGVVTQPQNGESTTSQETQTISTTDVFLFAGVGTPSDFTSSANLQQQLDTLNNVSNMAGNATSFELVTPKPGDQQASILNNSQPDSILLNDALSAVQDATNMFLVGNIPPQPDSSSALAQELESTSETDPDAVGVTPAAPTANQQSQSFADSLLNGNQSTE